MGKEEYVMVVFTNELGEEKRVKVKKGDRIMLKNKKYAVAGVTSQEEMGPGVRFEEVPKKSIKSLILKRKDEK